MNVVRHSNNPIITPMDVVPSRSDFIVECVLNAGVTIYNNEVILLLRVAERPIQDQEDVVKVPILDTAGEYAFLQVVEFNKADVDLSDSRMVNKDGELFLTSLSHLRIARSMDGVHFTVEQTPWMFPENVYETYGIEDPRITYIEGEYYINYSAVSVYGITTALAKTKDFVSLERLGIIFAPENRDVCIFPEKINEKYYALHRPVPKMIGNPEMWMAESPDLICWGNHKHLIGLQRDGWESGRIGGGAVPFKTEKGWVAIYHGADSDNRYCLGVLLLDEKDPSKVIARSKYPILEPQEKYELEGFFGNVVFSCGVLYQDQIVYIYYGCADTSMSLATVSIQDIYEYLGV